MTQVSTTPANQQTLGSAFCPSGVVVGGGGQTSAGGTSVTMNASFPAGPSEDGWIVEMNNRSASAASLTVYAICRNQEPRGYSVQTGGAVDSPSPADVFASISCPGASVPIGGGVDDYSSTNLQANINSSWPDGQGWSNWYNNSDGGTDDSVAPFVICAGN